jgi:2-polyprenyl-3-methyl-5-hydroxy-6-metoxy-1,4-benzoquinol methylase
VKRLAGSPELLDGALDADMLAGNLRDLTRFNRWLGGRTLSADAIRPLSMSVPSLTILDVGTGAADIARHLARSLGSAATNQVTATDIRPEIVEVAGRSSKAPVTIRLGRLEDEADASYDVVHASMVLHHLEPPEAVAFLREMRRVAREAVVVNDLERGRRWLAGAWLLTRIVTRNAYTRNDAPLSVRRAYTPSEVVDLAQQAGLRPVAHYRARPAYRYALVFVRGTAE